MQVAGLCKNAAVTARRQDELMAAARSMRDQHVGFLIVVEPKADKRTGERVVGVLTDRDVMVSVIAQDVDPHALTVDDVMTQSPIAVNQNASIEKALQLMSEGGVRRLPVVDDAGCLAGVLAMDDIIDWLGEVTDLMSLAIRKELTVERKLRATPRTRRTA